MASLNSRDEADLPAVATARRLLDAGRIEEGIGSLTVILATHPDSVEARRAMRTARRLVTPSMPPDRPSLDHEQFAELAATFGQQPTSTAAPSRETMTLAEGAPLRRSVLLWLAGALIAVAMSLGGSILWMATPR